MVSGGKPKQDTNCRLGHIPNAQGYIFESDYHEWWDDYFFLISQFYVFPKQYVLPLQHNFKTNYTS